MVYNIVFIGKSISHSLLPTVYKIAGEQIGIKISVTSLEYTESQIEKVLKELPLASYQAACITFPYKIFAYTHVNSLMITNRAKLSGAINIIQYDHSEAILADNTDGEGFLRDAMNNKNVSFENKNILIFGAGGTARSIMTAMIAAKPASITLCNRNIDKLQYFISKYSHLITFCDYQTIPFTNYDIVVNATSASIVDDLPPIPANIINRNTVCFECAYRYRSKTPFAKWCLDKGAKAYYDGLGMLIEQAAEAIEILLKQTINTQLIIDKINLFEKASGGKQEMIKRNHLLRAQNI